MCVSLVVHFYLLVERLPPSPPHISTHSHPFPSTWFGTMAGRQKPFLFLGALRPLRLLCTWWGCAPWTRCLGGTRRFAVLETCFLHTNSKFQYFAHLEIYKCFNHDIFDGVHYKICLGPLRVQAVTTSVKSVFVQENTWGYPPLCPDHLVKCSKVSSPWSAKWINRSGTLWCHLFRDAWFKSRRLPAAACHASHTARFFSIGWSSSRWEMKKALAIRVASFYIYIYIYLYISN